MSNYVLFSALYFVVGFCVAALTIRFTAIGDRVDREVSATVVMFVWPLCLLLIACAAISSLCLLLADYGKGKK